MPKRKKKMKKPGELIHYKPKSGGMALDVRLDNETIWLSQKQIAELFGTQRPAITKHLRNIFHSKELDEHSVSSILEHTAADGKTYQTQFYNLDAIISVGYRVNSKHATDFRIWATRVLRDHILKGFTVNQKRLKRTGVEEFEQALLLIKRTMQARQLTEREAKGLLDIVTDYADSWLLLQRYDEDTLLEPKTKKARKKFDEPFCRTAIQELKRDLMKKKQASDLFGAERGHGLSSIVATLNQTFDGEQLYPSIESKAAHLLYFIIKDHPFVDGNKRIGSFLFIVFLAQHNHLHGKNGEKKINDNALVALALLIAESDPKQKELMIRLVMHFLSNG